MRILNARGQARETLLAAGVPDAAADADWLLCHVLDIPRGELLLYYEQELPLAHQQRYQALVARRSAREPLQRITGWMPFMGLEFYACPGVLIARMDTEVLCEQALILARERGFKTALDLCTGSGVLAVCLARLGGLAATATDLSADCVRAAQKNAALHAVEIEVLQGDFLSPVAGRLSDLIVCNPPYIPQNTPLMPEVDRYDPPLALYAGADGLSFYRRLAAEAKEAVAPGGSLLMEVGIGQAQAVCAMFEGQPCTVIKDLSGIDRVVRVDY